MYIQHTHKQSTLFLIMELEEGVGGGGATLEGSHLCMRVCVIVVAYISKE